MSYTIKDASGNIIYIDGAGTGADAGNAITPNSTILGAANETAPATDTASSGHNGRLQRIAQRITSLIALLPPSIGQKAKTGSLSVTLASDQDALPITDNSGSITVDGTVSVSGVATAANQSTANTSLSSIDGKITAVNTGAVVVSSSALPSGAATSANQSTANTSLASLETKIGEVQANPTSNTILDRLKQLYTALTGTLTVATHAVTQSGTWTVQPGNTANTTAWKVDGSAVTQPVSATALPASLTSAGNLKISIQERAAPSAGVMTRAAINAASSGDNTLISAVSSQTIRVHKLFLVVSGAVNIKFKDGASTDFHPALPMQAGGGFVLDFDQEPWFITSTNTALVLNLSAAVQVSGRIYYTQS